MTVSAENRTCATFTSRKKATKGARHFIFIRTRQQFIFVLTCFVHARHLFFIESTLSEVSSRYMISAVSLRCKTQYSSNNNTIVCGVNDLLCLHECCNHTTVDFNFVLIDRYIAVNVRTSVCTATSPSLLPAYSGPTSASIPGSGLLR